MFLYRVQPSPDVVLNVRFSHIDSYPVDVLQAAQSPNMQKWGAPVAAAAALGAGIYYATSRSTVVKAGEAQDILMPCPQTVHHFHACSELLYCVNVTCGILCSCLRFVRLSQLREAITVDMME